MRELCSVHMKKSFRQRETERERGGERMRKRENEKERKNFTVQIFDKFTILNILLMC